MKALASRLFGQATLAAPSLPQVAIVVGGTVGELEVDLRGEVWIEKPGGETNSSALAPAQSKTRRVGPAARHLQ